VSPVSVSLSAFSVVLTRQIYSGFRARKGFF
jgi:hypothetical protein